MYPTHCGAGGDRPSLPALSPCNDDCDGACLKTWGFSLTCTGGAHGSRHSFATASFLEDLRMPSRGHFCIKMKHIYSQACKKDTRQCLTASSSQPRQSFSPPSCWLCPSCCQIPTSTSVPSHRQLLPGSLGIRQHFITIPQPLHTYNLEITLPGMTK